MHEEKSEKHTGKIREVLECGGWNATTQRKSPEQELRKGHWTQQSSSRAALKSPFRAGDRKTVK